MQCTTCWLIYALDETFVSLPYRYYTSIQVADWLLKEKKIMLGTMQKNRAGLPNELVDAKNKDEHGYEVYWDAFNFVLNLHSYTVLNKSTGEKNVILLSTVEAILGTTKKYKDKRPATIELYNYSKGGTDIGMFQNFNIRGQSPLSIKLDIW